MTAFNLPQIGDAIGRHSAVFTFGPSSDAEVAISSATGAQAIININEPGVMIHDMKIQIVTAFDGDTSLELTIGDTDVDGFMTDTLFGWGSSGAVYANLASTLAYALGRVYTTSDVINLSITGGATAGLAKVFIDYETGVDSDAGPSA